MFPTELKFEIFPWRSWNIPALTIIYQSGQHVRPWQPCRDTLRPRAASAHDESYRTVFRVHWPTAGLLPALIPWGWNRVFVSIISRCGQSCQPLPRPGLKGDYDRGSSCEKLCFAGWPRQFLHWKTRGDDRTKFTSLFRHWRRLVTVVDALIVFIALALASRIEWHTSLQGTPRCFPEMALSKVPAWKLVTAFGGFAVVLL